MTATQPDRPLVEPSVRVTALRALADRWRCVAEYADAIDAQGAANMLRRAAHDLESLLPYWQADDSDNA